MRILAFETSCDETSVAVLTNDEVLQNLVYSQDFHKIYGGVVPELSSRAHLQKVVPLSREALRLSGLTFSNIDLIAATAGPGLIGALLVGYTYAKGLSFALKKPFIPVNHIEGHIYSGFLNNEKPKFPMLCLVVSGGHTMLLMVESFTRMRLLGQTVDDAAGESFDKVAKMLGLPYPGGPSIQKAAASGDPHAVKFPVSVLKNFYDFSFSGLKTAVRRYIEGLGQELGSVDSKLVPDIAASFQSTAVKSLTQKIEKALTDFDCNSLTLVGGVAGNQLLRDEFYALGEKYKKTVVIPPMKYCGDNAAMIGFRAYSLAEQGLTFSTDYEPFPNFFSDYLIDD